MIVCITVELQMLNSEYYNMNVYFEMQPKARVNH